MFWVLCKLDVSTICIVIFVLPTFIFAGLDKGDLGRPGWSRRGLWSAIRAWWDAPLPRGTVIPPATVAALTFVTPASARASACSSVSTLATTITMVLIAIILITVLFLVLWHCLPVSWPWNRNLHFPFPTDSLGKQFWMLKGENISVSLTSEIRMTISLMLRKHSVKQQFEVSEHNLKTELCNVRGHCEGMLP